MAQDESQIQQPITHLIYRGGKSHSPESLILHPNATPEQIQRIYATMHELNPEVELLPMPITRKNGNGETLYIRTNAQDADAPTLYVKRDGVYYDEDGKESRTQEDTSFITATHDAIRFKSLNRKPEELIRALSIAGDHGLIDNSIKTEHEALVAKEDAAYRAPFSPFGIFDSTFPKWIYKAGKSLIGRGGDNDETSQSSDGSEAHDSAKAKDTGTKITIPKAFGLQDRAANFARDLDEKTIETIAKPYFAGDLMDLAKATVNSHNMLRPAGLGDYGFGGLAIASTTSMLALGSYNDGLNATERLNAKRRADFSTGEETQINAKQANRSLNQEQLSNISKKDRYEEMGDTGGMFGNFVSGFSLAFAGLVQLDPFKFTQGCIVATGFGVAMAGKYFGKPLDSLFSMAPEGVKKRMPGQLKELWARTLDDYHYPIRFVKNHNMMGFLSTTFNLVKNPGRIKDIETTYDPDKDPRYRGVEVEMQNGEYRVVRAGDWREKNTEQLRNMMNYVRDGWVAVDEEGKMSAISEKYFADTRSKTEPYKVTEEGKIYTLHPVPHAFEWDKDEKTGQPDYSKPPKAYTEFYDSVAKWQMFKRLVPSSVINFFEICTYLLANNLLGSVKEEKAELDLQEYYSSVALDLIKPVPGESPDQQKERRKDIMTHAVKFVHASIEEENQKVEASLNRHLQLHLSKGGTAEEFLEKVQKNSNDDFKKPIIGNLDLNEDKSAIIIADVPEPEEHHKGIQRAAERFNNKASPLRSMAIMEFQQAAETQKTAPESHQDALIQNKAVVEGASQTAAESKSSVIAFDQAVQSIATIPASYSSPAA
jgi:hypothetical protein